jgi:hypothetical protein
MKVTAQKTVIVEEMVEVDDRVHQEYCLAYKVAKIILEGELFRFENLQNDLYEKSHGVVSNAAKRINRAFATADLIIAEVKKEKP